jgi:two-component system sensor kinase FixL
MAEVASGVLHNVGNALNSMKTSAEMVRRMRRVDGDADALDGAAQLLRDHPADPRVPELLTRLASRQRREAEQVAAEVDRLRAQVDHVATIVAVQQDHARSRGLFVDVAPGELVREAMLVAFGTVQPSDIRIEVVDEAPGTVLTDRNQVLQIITNLLVNAKDEVRAAGGERGIRVCARRTAELWSIEVSDSGRGVRTDHRTAIFRHGFTTKDAGHGFGLHVSALAAQALGGNLALADQGPLAGACFVLELPIGPTRAPRVGATVAPA